MTRAIALTLIALFLLTVSTTGARADAEATWKSYRAGKYVEALAALSPEAAAGDAAAAYYLGTLYADGLAVARDYRAAAHWYRRAAEEGHAGAAFALGFLYLNGAGGGANAVAADHGQATAWLQRAAQQGDAAAQYWLGQLYVEGRGGQTDHTRALTWTVKAAEQGHAGAQYNAGFLQARSESFPARLQAYAWFLLADRQNCPGARENLAILADAFAPQEKAAAVRAADSWRPGTPLRLALPGG